MAPSLATSEQIPDSDLQPFFILRRPDHCKVDVLESKRGKARRKIELQNLSPNNKQKMDEDTGPDDGEDHLQSFNATWSKIECSIQGCMEKMNLGLFKEVQGWIFESFAEIMSSGQHSVITTLSPYPLIADGLCRQIFTALILTKNIDHVDDVSTFQDLGEHLRLNGCHVANLSSSKFALKQGVAGCLKSLFRQLILDSSEAFDMTALVSWYCRKENSGKPVVLIVDNIEQCCGSVLGSFISIISEWVIKIPIILFLGVATTTDALKIQLSSDSLKRLNCFRFSLPSPSEKMNAVVDNAFTNPDLGFTIGHEVTVFLRNYFSRHDGTIAAFIRALKISCANHYSTEPLSFLSRLIHDDETEGVSLAGSKLKLVFDLPSCRGFWKEKSCSEFTQCLTELKKHWRAWSCALKFLFEVGRICKMQLLDILCEASSIIESNSDKSNGFSIPPMRGRLIGQVIQKVREISPAALLSLLDTWANYAANTPEILDKVRELQSLLESEDDDDCSKKQPIEISRRAGRGFFAEIKGTMQVNEKTSMLLRQMIRDMLKPIESVPLHEIFVFKRVDVLKLALVGDPRKKIHLDLLKSTSYLYCNCCPTVVDKALRPCMHDSAILYQLAQEHGDFINIHDWYRSFNTILTAPTAARRKPKPSVPARSLTLDAASIQARFCRAVTELQVAGLLRMPSKRRPDHVQRLVLSLST